MWIARNTGWLMALLATAPAWGWQQDVVVNGSMPPVRPQGELRVQGAGVDLVVQAGGVGRLFHISPNREQVSTRAADPVLDAPKASARGWVESFQPIPFPATGWSCRYRFRNAAGDVLRELRFEATQYCQNFALDDADGAVVVRDHNGLIALDATYQLRWERPSEGHHQIQRLQRTTDGDVWALAQDTDQSLLRLRVQRLRAADGVSVAQWQGPSGEGRPLVLSSTALPDGGLVALVLHVDTAGERVEWMRWNASAELIGTAQVLDEPGSAYLVEAETLPEAGVFGMCWSPLLTNPPVSVLRTRIALADGTRSPTQQVAQAEGSWRCRHAPDGRTAATIGALDGTRLVRRASNGALVDDQVLPRQIIDLQYAPNGWLWTLQVPPSLEVGQPSLVQAFAGDDAAPVLARELRAEGTLPSVVQVQPGTAGEWHLLLKEAQRLLSVTVSAAGAGPVQTLTTAPDALGHIGIQGWALQYPERVELVGFDGSPQGQWAIPAVRHLACAAGSHCVVHSLTAANSGQLHWINGTAQPYASATVSADWVHLHAADAPARGAPRLITTRAGQWQLQTAGSDGQLQLRASTPALSSGSVQVADLQLVYAGAELQGYDLNGLLWTRSNAGITTVRSDQVWHLTPVQPGLRTLILLRPDGSARWERSLQAAVECQHTEARNQGASWLACRQWDHPIGFADVLSPAGEVERRFNLPDIRLPVLHLQILDGADAALVVYAVQDPTGRPRIRAHLLQHVLFADGLEE